LRHQPIELCVQLGNLSRESLVTASHRTERELRGCRRYVTRGICEAEACSHGDEFLRREAAQTVAEFVRCRHPQALELGLAACVLAFIAERCTNVEHRYGVPLVACTEREADHASNITALPCKGATRLGFRSVHRRNRGWFP
jgi:hypothetical protein